MKLPARCKGLGPPLLWDCDVVEVDVGRGWVHGLEGCQDDAADVHVAGPLAVCEEVRVIP
jgi:hypothetical protein